MAEDKLPKRSEDFSAWYNEIVSRAELAEHSPVRGCMVIRPNGYGIWELMQQALDRMFKETGHQNAYFPLFIPQSFIAKEASHVEGFAPELAIVTIGGGKELEEPLVVRPTSETIIYSMYAKWVQSYRDLPILMNQWANVVRWEMRTRLFLRTMEFLWQEGHTAHETEREAEEETLQMLGVYRTFMEEYMAMPVLTGVKSDSERFAGALRTYAVEGLMQDNKALQAGTSHNLGQNFAKVFDLTFQSRTGELEYAWNTSWGVSTRMVGALIMTHSDDDGLVTPPKLAPLQLVIVPIFKTDAEKLTVMEAADEVFRQMKAAGIRVKLDDRDSLSPGAKFFDWELKGIPLRMEIGPKDVQNNSVVLVPRVLIESEEAPKPGRKQKLFVNRTELHTRIQHLLEKLQIQLFQDALARREANSIRGISDYGEMKKLIERDAGFIYAGWCGSAECEAKVKEETKATIRVIPFPEFQSAEKPGHCIVCGISAKHEVVWAKSY
ncbi:MAG TPA: proline--tRNA ligase [Candidatus Kapabacteria bacterium]|nr:proline--tRNA ligase [Candidatus Kapabacteria bacterium]